MTPLTPAPDGFAERYDKLEKEHRNLIARLERLEKQRKSTISGFIGGVLLLMVLGLMLDYLGFLPAVVESLPLRARIIDVNELVLRAEDGKPWAKIRATGQKAVITYLDAAGRSTKEEPLFPR